MKHGAKFGASAESLERRCLLSAGDLNSAFGKDGIRSIDLGGSISSPQIATDTHGRILVSMQFTAKNAKQPQVLIARFTSSGGFDKTFGKAGEVFLSTGNADELQPSKPVIDSAGRILVCFDGDIVRLNSNGTLDKTFGGGGWVKHFGATEVAVAPDGKLVVTAGNDIERLMANGTIDRSFGKQGKFNLGTVEFSVNDFKDDFAYDPHVTSDGSIYYLSTAGDFPEDVSSSVSRLTPAGQRDKHFADVGGIGLSAFGQSGLAMASSVTSDGGIAVSVTCDDGGTIIYEFDSHGQPTKGFGADGVTVVFDGGDWDESLTQDSDGNLVCTTVTDLANVFPEDFDIVRLRRDGTFDSSFSGGESAYGFDGGRELDDTIRTALLPNQDIALVMPSIPEGSSDISTGIRLAKIDGTTRDAVDEPIAISADGKLTIHGTSGKDSIDVDGPNQAEDADKFLDVAVNGRHESFYQHGVKSISVDAGAGNDSLLYDETDVPGSVMGGAGRDQLISDAGNVVLSGGASNDTLIAYADDTLIGGAGEDLADFTGWTDSLHITLDNKANDGSTSNNKMNVESDIEDVIGGSANDLIVGNPSYNHLYGGPGNDTLWGGGGNDTLEGGHGHDQLFGQDGDDLLIARDQTGDTLDGGDDMDQASRDDSASVKDQVLSIESFI